MRVLLANPPVYGNTRKFNRPIRFPAFSYATEVLHPPLLLAYAASYIRSKGHDVGLIDAQALSMNTQEFFRQVEEFAPDYIVFETSTPSFKNEAFLARKVKERVGCKTIFVGPHVSAVPHESLANSSLDAVVMGEYEYPLLEYVEKGPEGTKGIAYKTESGSIVINERRLPPEDLDSFPYPARDLLPNYRYFDPILLNPFTFVLSGRGCPFKCTFCNWPQVLWGHRYRVRSPKNVVDELEYIEQNYDFKSFIFNDDTFIADKPRAMAICDEIIRRKVNLPWACYSRPDLDDIELLKKLRKAGCFLLKVGVESGNQEILNTMRKGVKIERIRKGIKLMKEFGFQVHATFVFGMPGETEKTINETIEFAKELDPTTVQFSTAIPYPETEFYRYLEEKGYLFDRNWDHFLPMQPPYEYLELSREKLCDAVRVAYRSYYFRRKYIKIGLKGLLTEPRRFATNFYTLLKFAF